MAHAVRPYTAEGIVNEQGAVAMTLEMTIDGFVDIEGGLDKG